MDGKAAEASNRSNPDPDFDDFSLNFEIPGSSSSLSIPSEPPDIRNWFSSYIYESPSLDSENGFDFSAAKAVGSGKLGACFREEDRVREGHEEESRVRVSDCGGEIFSGDDEGLDCLENYKGNQFIEGDVFVSNIGEYQNADEPSKNVSFPFKEDMAPCLENEHSPETHRTRATSSGNLLGREMHKRDNLRDAHCEEDDRLSCQRNANSGRSDESSLKSFTLQATDCREESNESKENGFISVKKNKHASENCSGVLRRISRKNHAANEVHKTVGRRPLSERTNARLDVEISETAGKWRCPQKTKPDFGPPMKQLRLERWVHRLQ
ncbi:hypothetical protein Syun_018547 [Stephania yunnanensis]|uniref:Uncharacterized protein n=1 Tax=Stephania yunnanensis TaxID=152371 RepID=A0AAP0ITK0_9MAGN